MKINVLGTEYEVIYDTLADDSMCIYEQKVLCHELIHAFMYESGLDVNSNNIEQWAMNEEMIDWMAIQMPKIMEAYESVIRAKKTIDVQYVDGQKHTIEI